jgi:hypothetical protein
MLSSPENQVKVLEALVLRPKWKFGAAQIGASESLMWKWLAESKTDQKDDARQTSRYWIKWRDSWDYFHNHANAARRDAIVRYESVVRDEAMNGIEVPLFTASGEPIWLYDPVAVAMDEGDRWLYKDWPYQHDANGGRIQACRRDLIPATTRNKVLEATIDEYRPHSSVDVNKSVVVRHVGRTLLAQPATPQKALPPPPTAGVSPLVLELRARAAALRDPNRKRGMPEGRANTGLPPRAAYEPPEKINGISAEVDSYPSPPVPIDPLRNPDPYKPQPNFGRPASNAPPLDGASSPPPGGFRVR